MKHGDISNTTGYTFGFRCENFLIRYKDATVFDKVYNALFDRAKRAEVNEEVFAVMEHIYRNTEYTVDLVINEDNYTQALRQVIDNMPFNRVVLVSKPTQITSRLNVGDLTYYVDDNAEYRALVNSEYAVSLDELRRVVRKGRL